MRENGSEDLNVLLIFREAINEDKFRYVPDNTPYFREFSTSGSIMMYSCQDNWSRILNPSISESGRGIVENKNIRNLSTLLETDSLHNMINALLLQSIWIHWRSYMERFQWGRRRITISKNKRLQTRMSEGIIFDVTSFLDWLQRKVLLHQSSLFNDFILLEKLPRILTHPSHSRTFDENEEEGRWDTGLLLYTAKRSDAFKDWKNDRHPETARRDKIVVKDRDDQVICRLTDSLFEDF